MKTWPQKLLRFFLLTILISSLIVSANVVSLTMNNLDQVLKGSQVINVFCFFDPVFFLFLNLVLSIIFLKWKIWFLQKYEAHMTQIII